MTTYSSTQRAARGGNVWVAGLVAALAAAVAVLIVHFITVAIAPDAYVAPVPPAMAVEAPVMLFAPLVSVFVFVLIGTVVLWAVKRFSGNPVRDFTIIAVVALILSYGTLLSPFAPPSSTTQVAFGIMHGVAAAVATPIMVRLGLIGR